VSFAVLSESVPDASFFEGDSEALGWGGRVLRLSYVTAFLAVLALPAVMLASSVVRSGRLVVGLMLPGLLLGMLLAVLIDPSLSLREHWWYIPIGVGFCLLLTIGLAGRQARNVVPLLALFLFGLSTFMTLLLALLKIPIACVNHESVAALLSLPGLIAIPWVGYRLTVGTLSTVLHHYDQNRFSDGQFQSAVWISLVTLVLAMSIGQDEEGGLSWRSFLGLAPAVAYFMVARRVYRHTPIWTPPVRLLLLRVFAHDRRGELLLDELAYNWRFIGPIRMISGPDLVCATLDVHELITYLARRLHTLFITDISDLKRRLASLSDQPDPDGRYRIDELFCNDASWRQAVEVLALASHAALLDLRGFSGQRTGTAFEIGLLARLSLMPRTVWLVDAETDHCAVEVALGTLQGCTPSKMQPHAILDIAQLSRGSQLLVRALAEAASVPPSLSMKPGTVQS
jgi:hypothetical protein